MRHGCGSSPVSIRAQLAVVRVVSVVRVVPAREGMLTPAASHRGGRGPRPQRGTADVRLLEPPLPLPGIAEMLWWHPRHTADPAHAWLRARIAEIAAGLELDRTAPAV
jgi:hypothetical protein